MTATIPFVAPFRCNACGTPWYRFFCKGAENYSTTCAECPYCGKPSGVQTGPPDFSKQWEALFNDRTHTAPRSH